MRKDVSCQNVISTLKAVSDGWGNNIMYVCVCIGTATYKNNE